MLAIYGAKSLAAGWPQNNRRYALGVHLSHVLLSSFSYRYVFLWLKTRFGK